MLSWYFLALIGSSVFATLLDPSAIPFCEYRNTVGLRLRSSLLFSLHCLPRKSHSGSQNKLRSAQKSVLITKHI